MTASRGPWIVLAYGYVVCLVAVITFIVHVDNFVDAAFDRANPGQSRELMFGGAFVGMGEPPARVAFGPGPSGPEASSVTVRADSVSPAERQKRYDAARAERLELIKYQATKSLVKSALMILLAAALFLWHWRWLRRQRELEPV